MDPVYQIPFKAIIPFGHRCFTAMTLVEFGIRHETYPFDWVVAPFTAIGAALADNLSRMIPLDTVATRTVVATDAPLAIRNDYEMVMPHLIDMNRDHGPQLPEARTIMNRRVERMRSLLSGREPILFLALYYETSEGLFNLTEARDLNRLIRQLYPHLNYQLLCLVHNADFQALHREDATLVIVFGRFRAGMIKFLKEEVLSSTNDFMRFLTPLNVEKISQNINGFVV